MPTRYDDFRQLHTPTKPLLLPNVWDAGSARLFESLGAAAVATSSAAVAWALGYRDGYKLPTDVAVALAANIARVVQVPVSVDIEDGYSDDPATVAETVLRLVDAGVAGINLEDGPRPAALLAAKIEKIKEETGKRGLNVFVNARTDVFLAGLAPSDERVTETLHRAGLYAKAGADGLFVPALVNPDQIRAVVAGIRLPLNVLAWDGLAPAAELAQLGVSRLSAGSGISQVLWKHAEDLAKAFLAGGKSETLAGQMPYGQLQNLF